MMQAVPSFNIYQNSVMNFSIIWKRKRFIFRSGVYAAAIAMFLFMAMSWKTGYEAMLRIEPELSTTGELTSIEAEMDVLQSWSTVSQAVKNMRRSVVVRADSNGLFLHLGYYFNQLFHVFSSAPSPDFAMYQPSMRLEYFDIIDGNDAYLGKTFSLEVGKEGEYTLYSPSGDELLKYKVGSSTEVTLPDSNQKLQLYVSTINAKEGTRFSITMVSPDDLAKDIQMAIKVNRKGFRERSGLMTVEYSNSDPVFAQQVLYALVYSYIEQAYDRSSLGKIRGLEKLQEKSQALRAALEDAQKALAEFKSNNQVVNIAQDQEIAYKRLQSTQDELRRVMALQKSGDATMTENHPTMVALKNQVKYLQKEMDQIRGTLQNLPEKEKEQSTLQSNIDIAKTMLDKNTTLVAQLYSEVETITGYANLISLNHAEKLPPLVRGIIVLILGFGIGAALALSWLIRHTAPAFASIRYEDDLVEVSSLPVVARYPFRWSGTQWLWYRKTDSSTVITEQEWRDRAAMEVEKIERSIPFFLPDTAHPVLLFTSVDDREGASFTARKVAEMSARSHKTLLIDSQIMKPATHRDYGVAPQPGLTDALIGKADIRSAVVETPVQNLYLLPAGTQTYNYHLISDTQRIQALLAPLADAFDRIIIEFPPLTPAICQEGVLQCANAVFVVVRRDTPTQKFVALMRSCNIDSLKAAFLILNKG